MKIAKLSPLTVLLPALTLLILNNNTARAATCSVPSAGYPTIQSAVDDLTCATINVAPGLYPENVSITRSLTLNGAQAGQPVSARISSGPAESTVTGANPAGAHPVFLIKAARVTVDGFTIRNLVTTDRAIGVQIGANSNDAVVWNNIIDGIKTLDAGANGTADAVWVQNGSAGLNISNNEMRNITSNGIATAIRIGDSSASAASENLYMHDNTITGVTSATAGASALVVTKISLSPVSCYFPHNQISHLSGRGWVHAVRIECNAVNALVQYCDFSNLASPSGDIVAVWLGNDNPNGNTAEIDGNSFIDLTEADYGIKVAGGTIDTSNMLNAGCNWWGSPDGPGPVGPGHGARVSPGIRFSPWRVTLTQNSCIGNNVPTSDAQCKNGGWIAAVRANGGIFKSQGDCIQYVNTGK